MCMRKGHAWNSVTLESDQGGGKADSQGLHIKGEEGMMQSYLPRLACSQALAKEVITWGGDYERGLDKMGCGNWEDTQSPEGMKHQNAPGGGGGSPAAQLIDILPRVHVNVRVALVAGKGLVCFQDHSAHGAMQRVVTLRPSGSAEPCL